MGVLTIAAAGSILCSPAVSLAQTSSPWQRDLDYLTTVLPQVHGNAFHTTSRARFDSAAVELRRRLPSLDGLQARTEFAALVALVGDGHTRVNLLSPGGPGVPADPDSGFAPLPIRAYWFSDGLYVRSARAEVSDLLGSRIIRIGGLPVTDVMDRLRRYTHRDNSMTLRLLEPVLLMRPAFLRAAGVIDSGVAVPLEFLSRDGRRFNRILHPLPKADSAAAREWIDAADAAGAEPPLWRRRNDENYWFDTIGNGTTLYLQFNAVRDADTESLEDFAGRVKQFLAAHPVQRVIVDLRSNGGGNWLLARPLINALEDAPTNRRGALFVVTGRATFSAAGVVAALLEDRTEAVLVGEPTGARPNTWGDMETFTLPHSGLSISYSIRFFQSGGPYDERPWVAPEVSVDLAYADYERGHDPVLAAIAGYGSPPSLHDRLMRTLHEAGVDAALALYDDTRSRPEHRWYWAHDDLSALGVHLWRTERVAASIPVWERMAADYPGSAEGYENLAETYASLGDSAAALASLEASLRIEPANGDALEVLEELCGHAAVAKIIPLLGGADLPVGSVGESCSRE